MIVKSVKSRCVLLIIINEEPKQVDRYESERLGERHRPKIKQSAYAPHTATIKPCIELIIAHYYYYLI